MRVSITYIIEPTEALQQLAKDTGIDHPRAEDLHVWTSSEHHLLRKHTPEQIAEWNWLTFLGDFDLDHLDRQSIDARPFLRACARLGPAGCFAIKEAAFIDSADTLLKDAELSTDRAKHNLVCIGHVQD